MNTSKPNTTIETTSKNKGQRPNNQNNEQYQTSPNHNFKTQHKQEKTRTRTTNNINNKEQLQEQGTNTINKNIKGWLIDGKRGGSLAWWPAWGNKKPPRQDQGQRTNNKE
jgi:hypothetical protein